MLIGEVVGLGGNRVCALPRWRRRAIAVLALFGWSVAALAGTPFIHSVGEIAVSSLDVSPDLSLQTSLEVGWKEDSWQASGVATVTDDRWTELRWESSAILGSLPLT